MGRWAIINGLLGLLVAGLAFGLVGTWTRRLPPIEVSEPDPVPTPAPTGKPSGSGKGKRGGDKGGAKTDLSPQALVTAIVDRDLFDVTRAKPTDDAKPVAVVPKETNPPPNTTLVGVRILGADREAFVNELGTVKRLHVGDQIAGYTVKGVSTDGLELASPSGDPVTMALTMEKKGAAAAPAAPAKAPTPGQQPRAVAGVGPPAAGVTQPSPAAGIGAKPTATPAVPGRPNMPPVPPPGAVPGAAPAVPPPAPVPGAQPGQAAAAPGGPAAANVGTSRTRGLGRRR